MARAGIRAGSGEEEGDLKVDNVGMTGADSACLRTPTFVA
jgi:hypothetical protein